MRGERIIIRFCAEVSAENEKNSKNVCALICFYGISGSFLKLSASSFSVGS